MCLAEMTLESLAIQWGPAEGTTPAPPFSDTFLRMLKLFDFLAYFRVVGRKLQCIVESGFNCLQAVGAA